MGNNILRGSLQVPCSSKTTVDRIKATIYQMLMIEILTFNERENTGFLNKFLVCKEIQSGNNILRGSLQVPCLLRTTADRIKAKYTNDRNTDL